MGREREGESEKEGLRGREKEGERGGERGREREGEREMREIYREKEIERGAHVQGSAVQQHGVPRRKIRMLLEPCHIGAAILLGLPKVRI